MLDKIPIITLEPSGIDTPNGLAKDTVMRFWDMCQWLFDEFTNEAIALNLKKTHLDMTKDGLTIMSDSDIASFGLHAHCRFLSYLTLICSIDRILLKMYLDFVDDVRGLKDANAINERSDEIKTLKIWRDKIAAHTSYADPKNDNEALQLTSLINTHGTSWIGNPPDFTKMYFGGSSLYSDGQAPSEEIPLIFWHETHEKMKLHFQAWISMFKSVKPRTNSPKHPTRIPS